MSSGQNRGGFRLHLSLLAIAVYLLFASPWTGLLSGFATLLSPDGFVHKSTLLTLWIIGGIDLGIILYFATRKEPLKIRLSPRWKYALLILLALHFIFMLDHRGCQSEEHAIKYPTALSLVLGSVFALMGLGKVRQKGRLQVFFLLAAAGLAFAAIDELAMIHEPLGGDLVDPALANQGLAVPSAFKDPDDVLIGLYAVGILAFTAVFFRTMQQVHSQMPTLFLLGVFLQLCALQSEIARYCIEEYFEATAALMYCLALWIAKEALTRTQTKRGLSPRKQ